MPSLLFHSERQGWNLDTIKENLILHLGGRKEFPCGPISWINITHVDEITTLHDFFIKFVAIKDMIPNFELASFELKQTISYHHISYDRKYGYSIVWTMHGQPSYIPTSTETCDDYTLAAIDNKRHRDGAITFPFYEFAPAGLSLEQVVDYFKHHESQPLNGKTRLVFYKTTTTTRDASPDEEYVHLLDAELPTDFNSLKIRSIVRVDETECLIECV